MGNLVICGDSFAKGIGCRDLINEPYGSLLSKELNMTLVNLAKGSSTNYSIFLQAKYAKEKYNGADDIIILTNTSSDRIEWFRADADRQHPPELSNYDVNYHEYPPYMEGSYVMHDPDHPMRDDPNYRGNMFTENLMGVIDFWETFASKGLTQEAGYYKRFADEPRSRMKLLYDYASQIHDPQINRMHSIGAYTMAHQMLKKAGIKHLIGTNEVDVYAEYIDRFNIVNINWGQLSLDYPDDLPSWHTSAEGHKVAAATALEKIKENGWA